MHELLSHLHLFSGDWIIRKDITLPTGVLFHMEGKSKKENANFAVLAAVLFKCPSPLGHDAVYTCKYARTRLPVLRTESQVEGSLIQ
jgi:hypothetical protein